MSEPTPDYTATIPGRYAFPDMPSHKRKELMQLRRHLIGTLRTVEKQLGMEQSIPERQR